MVYSSDLFERSPETNAPGFSLRIPDRKRFEFFSNERFESGGRGREQLEVGAQGAATVRGERCEASADPASFGPGGLGRPELRASGCSEWDSFELGARGRRAARATGRFGSGRADRSVAFVQCTGVQSAR